MPARNAAKTIDVAIRSVLQQSRQDFELLVVDNASTDGTATHVERYLGDNRVRLLSEQRLGPGPARNAALEIAKGANVSLLDSDDVWLPDYLEVMGALLDANPDAAVAYTDAWVLDDELRRIARQTAMGPYHPILPSGDAGVFLRALLEHGNFVFVGTTMRMATLTSVGTFRPLEAAEDYELWLRIAARGYRFVRNAKPLVIYRRSSGQTTADRERLLRGVEEVFRIVEEEYDIPDDVRTLARRRLPIDNLRPRAPRRVPSILRRPYKALARTRRFHFRAPKDVRRSYPDLKAL